MTTGTTSDPLSAARALRPTIREARQAIEAARCLTPPVVAGLIEAGLCRLALPRDLGGVEAEPVVALQVYEELAYADASVAWIAWNNQYVCLSSRYSPDAVWKTWFSDARLLFANSARATGTAVVVEGGVRVSGRWSLVSGCALADWMPLMCVLTDGTAPRMAAAGGPETHMAYVPKGSDTILDTWHSGGLRGTGSHDVVVEDVFVPMERTFSSRNAVALDRPLYRMPFNATMAAGGAAMCLGMAQAATDTVLELGGAQGSVACSRTHVQSCGSGRPYKRWWRWQRRSWTPRVCSCMLPSVPSGQHASRPQGGQTRNACGCGAVPCTPRGRRRPSSRRCARQRGRPPSTWTVPLSAPTVTSTPSCNTRCWDTSGWRKRGG